MAGVDAISFYLPDQVLSNANLNEYFPDWSVDKIASKTGIYERRIAAEDEFVSTMAINAARRLFSEHTHIHAADIQFILLCTQSPDYFLPTTACLIQEALGIPTSAGALDFNLGCSGYVYGLSLAKGLLLSEELDNVLLITADTYTKFIHHEDRSVRTIFGDAASATLITHESTSKIKKFIYGTDGKGAENLIVKSGALRKPLTVEMILNKNVGLVGDNNLFMNGQEIFNFTLNIIPSLISNVLKRNDMEMDDIDLFVFHQANKFMLEHLRKKLQIREDFFFISMSYCGNTVSSSIPIALKTAESEGRIKPGMRVLIAGFGVGYSWGATIIEY